MNKEDLKKFVEDNPKLVSMRPAGDGIFVLKYKKTVFYNNAWNNFLEECRGTIVDKDFNVVARPFTKIYNFRVEDKSPVLDDNTQVIAYRKVNGFLVSATWYQGNLLLSTTGSTDSDYVKMARELIDISRFEKVCSENPTRTFMFECVHKNDPHIIPEEEGMYFLGFRENRWDSKVEYDPELVYSFSKAFGAKVVEYRRFSIGDLMKFIKRVKHEGYVFYTQDGVSAKVKSPYYLTSKWVARNPRTDKLVDLNRDIKHNIDEEYHNLIDNIRLNIVEYTAMTEQERLAWVRNYFE